MQILTSHLSYRGWQYELFEDDGFSYRIWNRSLDYGCESGKRSAEMVTAMIRAREAIDVHVNGRERNHDPVGCAIELARHLLISANG